MIYLPIWKPKVTSKSISKLTFLAKKCKYFSFEEYFRLICHLVKVVCRFKIFRRIETEKAIPITFGNYVKLDSSSRPRKHMTEFTSANMSWEVSDVQISFTEFKQFLT